MKTLHLYLVAFFLPFLAFTSATHAQTYQKFLEGLQADLHFQQTSIGPVLEKRVSVARFSSLNRWLNPDATATYHPLFKRINLHEELLETIRGKTTIKDARVIRGPQYQYSSVVTVFHEMGHAELDTIIEPGQELIHLSVRSTYQHLLKDFYRETFKTGSYDIFHEHFAYYRTDLIEFLYQELQDIFMINGYNVFQDRCFLNNNLRLMLDNAASLEEFTQIHNFGEQKDFYRHKIGPRFVFVKGKDYDLHLGRDHQRILQQAHNIFWAYHQESYGFPMNREQFVQRLRKSPVAQKIAKCRTAIYHN